MKPPKELSEDIAKALLDKGLIEQPDYRLAVKYVFDVLANQQIDNTFKFDK